MTRPPPRHPQLRPALSVAALAVILVAASLVGANESTGARSGPLLDQQPAARAADDAPATPDSPLDEGLWTGGAEPANPLRDGSPQEADLRADPLDALARSLHEATTGVGRVFPGAVALVARNGVVAFHDAAGHAVRFADGDATELPDDAQRAMSTATIVDVASLSKLFTTIAVLQLADDGALDLDDPVSTFLPRFTGPDKDRVTVRHLLTHTSGMPAGMALWKDHDTVAERRDAVLSADLTHRPGTTRTYSDLGFIVLGELVEALRGRSLDEVVRTDITEPLGMSDTSYNPEPRAAERIAATEHQPWVSRGLVHGEVADPNAWALGGVAGHAGVFSTARDLAVLAHALLDGGRSGQTRILASDTVAEMMADQLGELDGPGQGLGFWRAPCQLTDELTSAEVVGHTGYTGTSLVIDPHTETVVVLLTNRVHPHPDGPRMGPHRRTASNAVAAALPADADRGPQVECDR